MSIFGTTFPGQAKNESPITIPTDTRPMGMNPLDIKRALEDKSVVYVLYDKEVVDVYLNDEFEKAGEDPDLCLQWRPRYDYPYILETELSQAQGLLFIPPLEEDFKTISAESFREVCTKRMLKKMSGRLAYNLARVCRSATSRNATNEVFDEVHLRADMCELLRANWHAIEFQPNRPIPGLNDKTDFGVFNLMGALLRTYTKKLCVFDNPDEHLVLRMARTMKKLKSICWEHPVEHALVARHPIVGYNNDGVIYNVPGLQGIALGHSLRTEGIDRSIANLPLKGLGVRVKQYLFTGPKETTHTAPWTEPDNAEHVANRREYIRQALGDLTVLSLCIKDPELCPPDERERERPTPEDMEGLKRLCVDADRLQSLVICTDTAVRKTVGDVLDRDCIFRGDPSTYESWLPKFSFRDDECMPPLVALSMYRYDWAAHTQAEVLHGWDFGVICAVLCDHSPPSNFIDNMIPAWKPLLELQTRPYSEWITHDDAVMRIDEVNSLLEVVRVDTSLTSPLHKALLQIVYMSREVYGDEVRPTPLLECCPRVVLDEVSRVHGSAMVTREGLNVNKWYVKWFDDWFLQKFYNSMIQEVTGVDPRTLAPDDFGF